MQLRQLGRLYVPGLPNVQIALDRRLLLLPLALAYVLLPLLDLAQQGVALFGLHGMVLHGF